MIVNYYPINCFLLLPILFFINSISATAQDYKCFNPFVKQYFVNEDGYLRGIRIDSVKNNGPVREYYPFKTLRGSYDKTQGAPLTKAGSWLGEKVIEQSDGTWLFDNIWKDTIVIKTNAALSDEWEYYNDTSSVFYKATVYAVDTMTVSGSLDSVKKMAISVHDRLTGPLPNNPLNGLRIFLSKNNGFVKVPDIYTFPYQQYEKDYFLDVILTSNPVNLIGKCTFDILSFTYPTYSELYDFNAGDVLEYTGCFWYPGPYCPPSFYFFDTITTKTISANGVSYSFNGSLHKLINNPYPPQKYEKQSTSGIRFYTNIHIADISLMPEEYPGKVNLYYAPNDTSFCTNSALYTLTYNRFQDTVYYGSFEAPWIRRLYKKGWGLLTYESTSFEATSDTTLVFANVNGNVCGSYFNLGIKEQLSSENVLVYPNPVSDEIHVKLNNQHIDHYTITVTNALGQRVFLKEFQNNMQLIDVKDLPSGIYDLSISSENSGILRHKVSVIR